MCWEVRPACTHPLPSAPPPPRFPWRLLLPCRRAMRVLPAGSAQWPRPTRPWCCWCRACGRTRPGGLGPLRGSSSCTWPAPSWPQRRSTSTCRCSLLLALIRGVESDWLDGRRACTWMPGRPAALCPFCMHASGNRRTTPFGVAHAGSQGHGAVGCASRQLPAGSCCLAAALNPCPHACPSCVGWRAQVMDVLRAPARGHPANVVTPGDGCEWVAASKWKALLTAGPVADVFSTALRSTLLKLVGCASLTAQAQPPPLPACGHLLPSATRCTQDIRLSCFMLGPHRQGTTPPARGKPKLTLVKPTAAHARFKSRSPRRPCCCCRCCCYPPLLPRTPPGRLRQRRDPARQAVLRAV